MSAHNDHISNTGAQPDVIFSRGSPRRVWSSSSSYSYRQPTSYWQRLIEPSILVPFLVLLASIFLSANILDVIVASISAVAPATLRERVWNGAVSVLPASPIFAVDDWLAPFPLPRQPFERLGPAAAHEAKSNALARIFGVGPGGRRFNPGSSTGGNSRAGGSGGAGGLFASVTHAGKTGLSRLMPKGDIDRPAGLGNSSNSCYQNSVLQALSSLEPLRKYLEKIADEELAGNIQNVETSRSLDGLVHCLSTPVSNGETLWTPPILKRMSTFQQQDAQEYFCKLLSEIEEEVGKALKAVQSKPDLASDLSLSLGLKPPIVLPLSTKDKDTERAQPADDKSTEGNSDNDGALSDDSGYHTASSASSRFAADLAKCFRIPLEGLLAQRIVCQACGYSSGLSMSPFYSLTVNPDIGSPEYRLEETLDNFTAVENIEGVQCAKCTLLKIRRLLKVIIERTEAASKKAEEEGSAEATPQTNSTEAHARLAAVEEALEDDDFDEKTLRARCKIPEKQRVHSTKSRQVGIARAPQSIAFHINRSRFDERTGYTFKNPAAIRFPLRLDLGPWCLGSAANPHTPFLSTGDEKVSAQDPSDEGSDDAELWQLPAQLPMVAGVQHNPRLTGPLYELRAVVTHYGQHENGHYVCYRKHPIAKEEVSAMAADNVPIVDAGTDDMTSDDDVNNDNGLAHDEETLRAPSEAPTDDDQTVVDDASMTDADNDDAATESAEPRQEDKEEDGQWWRLSDSTVTRSDEETVLSQGGVFMLFYDRVDAKSIFRPAAKTQPQSYYSMALESSDTLYSLSTETADPKMTGVRSPGPARTDDLPLKPTLSPLTNNVKTSDGSPSKVIDCVTPTMASEA